MKRESFHERLKNLRLSRNLKQSDVINETKIPLSTYSDYENGNTQPSLASIAKLADFFNVTADYLIGRTRSPDGLVITILPESLKTLGINYITVSAETLYKDGLLESIYKEKPKIIKEEPFNEKLKRIRLSKGISQRTISNDGIMASSTYNNYETGISTPALPAIIKLAEYFNVTADYLVGRVDEPDGLVITVLPEYLTASGIKYITIPASRFFKDGILEDVYKNIYEDFKNMKK